MRCTLLSVDMIICFLAFNRQQGLSHTLSPWVTEPYNIAAGCAEAELALASQPAARSCSLQPGSARSASRVFLRLTLSGYVAHLLPPEHRARHAVHFVEAGKARRR